MSPRRLLGALTAALLLTTSLTGCLGGRELDTDAIATEITATSDSIDETTVDTSRDGLTTELYVRPVITTDGLTASELGALLRVAYDLSVGQVSTIEIRTVDEADEPISLESAAAELGIHYLSHTNSISYSTTVLDEEYGD